MLGPESFLSRLLCRIPTFSPKAIVLGGHKQLSVVPGFGSGVGGWCEWSPFSKTALSDMRGECEFFSLVCSVASSSLGLCRVAVVGLYVCIRFSKNGSHSRGVSEISNNSTVASFCSFWGVAFIKHVTGNLHLEEPPLFYFHALGLVRRASLRH